MIFMAKPLGRSVKVGVLDYGAGNFLSVVRALQALGAEPVRIAQDERHGAEGLSHLIFPGVGRASQAMEALRSQGLDEVILRHVAAERPLLGICVGMQVLGRWSSEDQTPCLGLMDFELRHFRELGVSGPVPHMGWNDLSLPPVPKSQSPSDSTPQDLRPETVSEGPQSAEDHSRWRLRFVGRHVYFVHSYAAPLDGDKTDPGIVLATSDYGGVSFVAAVAKGPVMGFQFHAEKSGAVGLEMLADFLALR